MATPVVWNGVSYSVPATGEEEWGGTSKVDGLLIALVTHGLQKTGGTFTLSADVDLGAAAGLKAGYYKSRATNLATTGVFRFGNTETVTWRNFANDGNLSLTVTAGDVLAFNGNQLLAASGSLTASRLVVTDGSAVIATNAVTATEAGYLAGVTSAIQTQLGTKAPLASPTFTTSARFSYATATTVPYWDASKDLVSSAVTPTELGRLSGITSSAVGLTDSQVLTNKTLTTPTLSDGLSNGLRRAISAALTGNTTLDGTYSTVKVDGTSAFTVTLPAAASHTGRVYTIVRIDQTLANAVTVDGNASETINGALTFKLMTQYERVTIQSDGTNWFVLEHSYPTTWTAFTPTGSLSSNSTYTGFWRRVGDSIEVDYKIAFSNDPGSYSTADITCMPTGLTFATAKMSLSTADRGWFGTVDMLRASQVYVGAHTYKSTTALNIVRLDEDGTNVNIAPLTDAFVTDFINGDFIHGRFMMPVTNWEG